MVRQNSGAVWRGVVYALYTMLFGSARLTPWREAQTSATSRTFQRFCRSAAGMLTRWRTRVTTPDGVVSGRRCFIARAGTRSRGCGYDHSYDNQSLRDIGPVLAH